MENHYEVKNLKAECKTTEEYLDSRALLEYLEQPVPTLFHKDDP